MFVGSIFFFPNLSYFPVKPKKESLLSLLAFLMIKGFGSFSGGSCIHEALMLQHAAAPCIILSNTQCLLRTFIRTHSILIRCLAPEDCESHLSASGRKAGEVSQLCRLMLRSSRLNPSCACDVQPPRKQVAHSLCALCFHDCNQVRVCVRGTRYNSSGWAYYFFSQCSFCDQKGMKGLMCVLLASFLTHAPVHNFIR